MTSYADSVALLERAARYLSESLPDIAWRDFSRPTPCAGWDLGALLAHLTESLAVLDEILVTRRVAMTPATIAAPLRGDSASRDVRDRVAATVAAWTDATRDEALCHIGERSLPASTAARIGAIELAVHCWDVCRACGLNRPIPVALAEDLLAIAPELVTRLTRQGEFAEEVALPWSAPASDRLLAFLGRRS